MGLDWVVLARDQGKPTELQPTEVLKARRLSRSDPETIAEFRRLYDQRRRLRPGCFIRVMARLTDRQRLGEWWMWEGTFDQALERQLRRQPPIIIFRCSGDGAGGMPKYEAAVQYYGFRGQMLDTGINDVSAFAADGYAFVDLLYEDMSPAQGLERAEEMERALAAYRLADFEHDPASMAIYEDAIKWLRFWAGRGFAIAADY